MEIWFDLQNASVVSDLQNILLTWFRCQHETEMLNYAGKKTEKGVTETQGHYIGILHILPPKFSSRGGEDLILSVK